MPIYEALGLTLALDVDDPDLARAIERLLSPMVVPDRAADATVECVANVVRCGDQQVTLEGDAGRRLSGLLQFINRYLVEATPICTLHAGAVTWQDRALVLPAEPDAGKSTLTAALVRAGFDYLTDEGAAMKWHDPVVRSYAKPFALSTDSFQALGLPIDDVHPLRGAYLPATDLRPDSLAAPAPLGWVMFPRYGQGEPPRIEPLTRGETVLEMARHTFGYDDQPRVIVEHHEVATAGVAGFRLVTGDLHDTVDLVRSVLQDT